MFTLQFDLSKTNLIVKLTAFFWIFAKIFSYNLWHTVRLFPLIPPFHFLENIPNFVHLTLFYLAIVGIAIIGFFSRNKVILGVTIGVEIASCLLDQGRWQPWEYQYLLTFLFFFFYRDNPKQFINYCSFLLFIIYFNSGLHKLNGSFLYKVWEEMILVRFLGFDYVEIQNIYIHYAGLALGMIEITAALGCLFSKNKKFYALLLVGMHIFILLLISPTGLNYNAIVWPWNVMMIIIVLLLFYNENATISFKNLIVGYNKIPFIVLGILPFFCYLGLYDNFFSFNLYSGGLKHLSVCVSESKIDKEYHLYFSEEKKMCGSKKTISVSNWVLKELNVVAYPEVRFYEGIIKKWKEKNPNSEAQFYIYEYPYKPENYVEYK